MADKRNDKMMKEVFNIQTKLTPKERLNHLTTKSGDRILVSVTGSDTVSFYSKNGEKEDFQIQMTNESILRMDLDYQSNNLAVLTKDKVCVFSLTNPKSPPVSVDSDIGCPSCISFANTSSTLAIGTSQGGLVLFNVKTSKKINIASKHPKRVTFLSWSSSDALISKSDDDTVHVSKDSGESHEEFGEVRRHHFAEIEQSFFIDSELLSAKMRSVTKQEVGGKTYLSNLEQLKSGGSALPENKAVKESIVDKLKHNQMDKGQVHSNQVMVVVMKGGKEVAFMCSGEGLSVVKMGVPNNQGRVVGVSCTCSGDLVVCTSRGFVARWAFKEGSFHEVQCERMFQNALEVVEFDFVKGKAFCCGDNCLKVVDLKQLKEEKESRVAFDKSVSAVASVCVNNSGGFVTVNSTSGALLGYMIQSEQVGRMFNHVYAVKVSLNEIVLRSFQRQFDYRSVADLDNATPTVLKFTGPEITDFVCLNNSVVIAQHRAVSCHSTDMKLKWRIDCDSPVQSLYTDAKSKVLVVTVDAYCLVDACTGIVSTNTISAKQYPNPKVVFTEFFTAVLSRNQCFVFENSRFKLMKHVSLPGNVTNFFIDDKSMQFFFYDQTDHKLTVYRNKLDSPHFELPLHDKHPLASVLFDSKDPNLMCLFHESGNIYSVCKKESHYKSPCALHVVREILQPSDLAENGPKTEPAVTILDSDIHPVKLTDGFLVCLEKGITPTGCYLSSHSFKMGSFGQFNEEINPKVNSMLDQQSKFERKPTPTTPNCVSPVDNCDPTAVAPTPPTDQCTLTEFEKEYHLKSFFQTVELNSFRLAFKAAEVLNIATLWNILALTSLKSLDLEVAKCCYQKLHNWSMSYYLKYLLSRNKKTNDLRADVAVILCDYEFAKGCYLQNGRTDLAIELSMNLQEYQQALEMAQKDGLAEYEMMASFELAEIDSKNEELIKAESVYVAVLKRLEKLHGIKSLNNTSSVSETTAYLSGKQSKSVAPNCDNKENECLVGRLLRNSPVSQCHKFKADHLLKSTVLGLTALYLRQGSVIKASETIDRLSASNVEELEELAAIAQETEHFSFATDIYARIGCTRKELDVRLTAVIKQSQHSRQAVDEFAKTVRAKMHSVNDSEVLLKLAQFFQERDKELAADLFRLSGNSHELIKFVLNVLKDVGQAERIFEDNKSNAQQAAFFIADFFIQNPSAVPDAKRRAVKYFLYSGRKLEALKMAFETDAVESYCELVTSFDEKEAGMLAKYFASKTKFDQAGRFFLLAGQYEKALLSFVKSRDFDSAIDLVFKLKDDELFELMVQVFAGETVITSNETVQESLVEDCRERVDREEDFMEAFGKEKCVYGLSAKHQLDTMPEPVDPIYLFKLYLKFSKVDQANTIALAIIDRELIDGSYKSAYNHGCSIMTQLMSSKAKMNTELRNKVLVLHSYVLVKRALKFDNHLLAALLLNRVCSFLHYLPKKETDILTSAVIEATKAGLKGVAYNWALTLCKPQYRSSINPKLKDKIERIALKPVNSSELSVQNYSEVGWKNTDSKSMSGVAKCPNCNTGVSDCFGLSCSACCNDFMICVATGKALLVTNKRSFLKCGCCLGVGYEDELRECFRTEECCPMCENKDISNFITVEMSEIVKTMKE